jgi:deaminated glutathione amidase
MSAETTPPAPAYTALALQTRCFAVNSAATPGEARERMARTIERVAAQVRGSKAFIGPDTRLVVLPEYFLTGFPLGESIEDWAAKAALHPSGPEYDKLGQVAQHNDVFLAGNAYETDDHFPGIYFQTSFLIDPSGSVVLRYRRLISMYAPTPHDVWDRYLDLYGLDGVFPVADTELGRIAAIASEEILYPEVARCLAMRGAEIFLHSSSETCSDRLTPKQIARRARAIENLAYVVSANSAGIEGIGVPFASADGHSQVIDYRGTLLADAAQGETMVAHAPIDLAALRHYRRRPGMGNILARQRFELFAESYGTHSFHPANTLLDNDGQAVTPSRGFFRDVHGQTIARLVREGVIR